ncbi:SHOCT domain-containing protein [Rhodocaloribacter sp.]
MYDGWMWGMHWGWWIFWILLIIILVTLFWKNQTTPPGPPPESRKESPLEILKRRYAAGEISTEEYEERKARLERDR